MKFLYLYFRKISAVLAVVLALSGCCPAGTFMLQASAAEQTGSVTIKYIVPNAGFTIYEVSRKNGDSFAVTDQFKAYSSAVDLDKLNTTAEMKSAAEILSAYAQRDSLSAYKTGKTDSSSELKISDLEPALYLIVGDVKTYRGYVYIPSAVLLYVPGKDESGDLQYDRSVVMEPKTDRKAVTDKKTSVTAYKIWENDSTSSRPASVKFQLLKNGRLIDTRTVDGNNNWKYVWTGLESGARYQVIERSVPDGYLESFSRSGSKWIITNTRNTTPKKTTVTTAKTTSASHTGSTSKIPQTGQLWWPVSFLFCGGLLLILIGYWRKTRDHK